MHNDVPSIPAGGPLAGIVITAVGLGGYGYQAAIKFLAGNHPALAQAAPPSWTWDGLGQAVTAVLAIAGSVWTWLSLQQSRRNDERRREEEKDAMSAIKIFLAEEMAKVQVEQAKIAAHLHRQDEAIDAVKQAVQPTAS